MPWTSRIPQMQAALDRAIQDGLNAGAQHYANEEKRELAGGYTSGDFVTGNVLNSVTVVPAQRVGAAWEARVGTNVMYALFWEIGHLNLFTRRFERVETWRPVLVREAGRIRDIALARAEARLRSMQA